jgi:hypothetical protein
VENSTPVTSSWRVVDADADADGGAFLLAGSLAIRSFRLFFEHGPDRLLFLKWPGVPAVLPPILFPQ